MTNKAAVEEIQEGVVLSVQNNEAKTEIHPQVCIVFASLPVKIYLLLVHPYSLS